MKIKLPRLIVALTLLFSFIACQSSLPYLELSGFYFLERVRIFSSKASGFEFYEIIRWETLYSQTAG